MMRQQLPSCKSKNDQELLVLSTRFSEKFLKLSPPCKDSQQGQTIHVLA